MTILSGFETHPIDQSWAALATALRVTVPLLCFLTAALTLTEMVRESRLIVRVAGLLARAGRGSCGLLLALVCGVCALLTLTVSLDGAVVLMAPLVAAVGDAAGVRRGPLLAATIVVANALSPAVPQANPTNLVVIARLGIGSAAFVSAMVLPALVATAICLSAVWLRERRFVTERYSAAVAPAAGLSSAEWTAIAALVAAAVLQSAAPVAGVAPWWPICLVAVALAASRGVAGGRFPRPVVPWRIGAQVLALAFAAGLLVRVAGIAPAGSQGAGAGSLVVVAAAAALLAALLNNLPASVVLASLLAPGPAVYAALLGLSVGALASRRGSVATMIALDLSDRPTARSIAVRYRRVFFPVALAATAVAAAGVAAGW